jgi:GAF domain-containing protein
VADWFMDSTALQRSLATLRGADSTMEAETGLSEALRRVIFATRELFGAAGAGLMMLDDESMIAPLVATDEPGRLLEERQYEHGHGPCVDSLTYDHVVSTADLATDDRWPQLGDDLPQLGVRAILGVPIHAANLPVGTLNVYRDRPGDWRPDEVTALAAYARLVESLLDAALQAHQRGELAAQLQHALDHRVVIERAVGVTMARRNLDAVEAFNLLRRAARNAGRAMADVAAEVLSELPGPAAGPSGTP